LTQTYYVSGGRQSRDQANLARRFLGISVRHEPSGVTSAGRRTLIEWFVVRPIRRPNLDLAGLPIDHMKPAAGETSHTFIDVTLILGTVVRAPARGNLCSGIGPQWTAENEFDGCRITIIGRVAWPAARHARDQ
jgi:hypothetical protein